MLTIFHTASCKDSFHSETASSKNGRGITSVEKVDGEGLRKLALTTGGENTARVWLVRAIVSMVRLIESIVSLNVCLLTVY